MSEYTWQRAYDDLPQFSVPLQFLPLAGGSKLVADAGMALAASVIDRVEARIMAPEGVLGIGELGLERGRGRAEHSWTQFHVRNLRRLSASTSYVV